MSTAIVQALIEKRKDFSIEETFFFWQMSIRTRVFSTSFGQEDKVTALITNNNAAIKIFTLDTGRLFQETYDVSRKQLKV
jgi:phosphoadenosine phosphosulfate reductase